MQFRFWNKALIAQLAGGTSPSMRAPCALAAARLINELDRYEFKARPSSTPADMTMSARDITETASLVDWCAEILRTAGWCDVSAFELVGCEEIAGSDRPIDLFTEYAMWASHAKDPSVSLARYPSKFVKAEPCATVGNLCAAVGLAVLDGIPSRPNAGWDSMAMTRLSAAWDLALLASSINRVHTTLFYRTHSAQPAGATS